MEMKRNKLLKRHFTAGADESIAHVSEAENGVLVLRPAFYGEAHTEVRNGASPATAR